MPGFGELNWILKILKYKILTTKYKNLNCFAVIPRLSLSNVYNEIVLSYILPDFDNIVQIQIRINKITRCEDALQQTATESDGGSYSYITNML